MTTSNFTLLETIEKVIKDKLIDLHTITIAKVTKVNEKTIDAQPIIPRVVDDTAIAYPNIPNIPVIFLHGGASYETYPISVGDYCVLFCISRATDNFLNGQDNTMPVDERMHSLTDCFALVGVKTDLSALNISDRIIKNGDMNYTGNLAHAGDNNQTGNYTITGNITQTGDNSITGNINQTGNNTITGNAIVSGVATVGSLVVGGSGGVAMSNDGGKLSGEIKATNGASGTFTDKNDRTVTVVDGIVTSIS